jgi:imidazolonepropionase-like amidohydrolase
MVRSVALAGSFLLVSTAVSADVIVFRNVRVLDGTSPSLSAPLNVLVRDNLIERMSADPITPEGGDAVTRINGAGNTLMPGLIGSHSHMIMGAVPQIEIMMRDQNYIQLRAGAAAGEFL